MRNSASRGHSNRAHPYLELAIESIVKGGEGVARAQIDGKMQAILVARGAPGDVVLAEVGKHAGALRGRIVRLIHASPDRVQPVCADAEQCGGCDLMHLTASAQRHARAQIVQQVLSSVTDVPDDFVEHHAALTEGYRVRVRLAALCTSGGVIVGYRQPNGHRIVPVTRCWVACSEIDQCRSELSQWLKGSEGDGEVVLSRGRAQLPAVQLRWRGQLASSVFATAEKMVSQGQWAGVQVILDGVKQAATIGDPRGIVVGCDGVELESPPGAFMQASQEMGAKLASIVCARAACDGLKTLELHCGSGNLTVALARVAGQLSAVESDQQAVLAAQRNLQARGLCAKVSQADADAVAIGAARVVVLDPPRAGAAGAIENLAKSKARRVTMASCDPATLRRDVSTLVSAGFRLESVDVLEMFPHTSHVETVVALSRTSG